MGLETPYVPWGCHPELVEVGEAAAHSRQTSDAVPHGVHRGTFGSGSGSALARGRGGAGARRRYDTVPRTRSV